MIICLKGKYTSWSIRSVAAFVACAIRACARSLKINNVRM